MGSGNRQIGKDIPIRIHIQIRENVFRNKSVALPARDIRVHDGEIASPKAVRQAVNGAVERASREKTREAGIFGIEH